MYRIVEKRELAEKITLFVLDAPFVAANARPGQFVILRVDERGERIPLTIASTEGGKITIVVQEVGKTTAHLRSKQVGDALADVVGPLGTPADIRQVGTVVCVSGGVGTAIIYPEAKGFKEAGNKVITLMGARSESLLFFTEELAQVSDRVMYATDDGSFGHHGFVTDLLQQLIDGGTTIDQVVAIGPIPMMRATCELTKKHRIKTVVSLNPVMVDGTGMCGACRVTVGGETKFCCTDGPEFDGHQVDFQELAARNSQYVDKERLSFAMHQDERGCGGRCHG
ncbi:MAG: sulfide/dihydroorotate dehydrogenase-like FAD/NAD-binding protein [Firmicutes bacterium]|nr:sulfide/dihydroorotate dehydrogenase-like FAD/NAD-binding protein [Bacillota bacterium]